MPLTLDEYRAGLTIPEYWQRLKTNQAAIIQIFETLEPPAEARAWFDGLAEPLRLAVFTEDWCGDALTSTPSILKLADRTAGLDVRIWERDKFLELTNSYLPPHRAGTLPIFAVYNADMQEVARFIETAKELQPLVGRMSDELRARLLSPAEAAKPLGELTPESRATFGSARAAYRVAHTQDWGEIVVRAFTACVQRGLALPAEDRPALGGTEWPPPSATPASA